MAIIRANNNTLSSVTALPSGVGGNLVLVTDTTISSGATSVVLGPLTTYDKYIIELMDVNHSTSGGAILKYNMAQMQVHIITQVIILMLCN